MAITCALGPKHIDALAKAIYKKMSTLPQGEVFDINGYMDYLYQNIAERQGIDNALQYMQQFPYLANIIAAKLIDVVEIDPSVNLAAMAKAYRNPDTGWQAVNARFNTELTPEAMDALSDYEANTPSQEDYEDEIPEPITEASDDRLKASSALSGTLQQFLTKNPNDKAEDVIETPDPSKTYIKLTISKIQNIAKDLAIGSTINYQGKFLRLKVVNLASLPRDERTPDTDALVGKMIGISDEETKKNDVTPLNELFALVLTDEAGNTIYFNQKGDVTTKQNGGKPVYQMMRDVRFQDNRFTVRDIYNKEDQIISPKDEAINTIRLMGYKSISQYEANENTTFNELVKTIDKEQQAQFKKLHELKKQAMSGKAPLLFVTGASVGVLNERVKQDINLSDAAAMQSDTTNTFLVLNEPAYGLRSGTAIVTINGETFPVDRTDIPKDISEKIAQVLQSDSISNEDKIAFYNQFFNDKVVNLKTDKDKQDVSFVTSTRRHKLVKSKSGKPFFVYADYTLAELNANKSLVNKVNFVPLDGSQQSIDKIKEVLNGGKASIKDGKVTKYGAKLNYMNGILTSDFYDYVDGKLVKSGTYKDFLTRLNPRILISKTTGLPLYNSYIRFAIPDARSSQVNKAQERAKEDSRSAIRKFKDNMVEVVKDAEPKAIKVKVTNVIEKQYPDRRPSTYNYDVVIEGQEGTHRFYNAQSRVNIGDTYYLTVEDVIDGGFLFKDTVKARVDSKKSGALDMGSLGERDFKTEDLRGIPIETVTAAETEQAVELDELTPAPNSLPEDQVEADQEEHVNPSNTTQPSDSSPISRRFKRDYGKFKLDRSAKLSNEVTQEQVDAATTWWNNSPLSKFISLEHVANIVNSNVYARFIAAGSELLAEQNLDGKLGKILINEATKGSMVDTYHEAWHVFSQLFLTREEKLKLYNEVRNSDPKFKNLSAFAIEEMLAEDFRSYALSSKTTKGAPVRNTLFRRILNFLKKLFTSKQSLANQIQPNEISTYGVAGELFNKLYFASNNPELLNDYTPLVDNVQFDMLNRGIRQQNNYKEDALNDRDSLDLSNALDSLISEEIDNAYLYTKEHNGADANKSGSVNILLRDDNKTVLYEFLKEELQDRVDAIKSKLPVKPATPFNSLNTINDISTNAIAVIKNSKGNDEYFFLRTQIEDFDNLNLDNKKGERVKGETYKDAEVIGDFYTHKAIKGVDKTPANIVIVNSLEEARAQFEAYKQDTTYTEIIENPNAGTTQPDLDFAEQQDLDRLRIFQTAISNWDNVVKFHKDHSDFNIINKKVALQESDPESNSEEANNDENEIGGENFNSSVGDVTLQQLADNEVIYMLKSLFALSKTGNYEYDRLGFKKRASFKKVWNALVRSTNGAKDPQTIYNRIVEASATYPELKQLVDYKLPNPQIEDHKNGTSFSITTSFWNAFSLPRIKYIQLLVNEDKSGTTTEVTNTSMDIGSTKRKFTSQFKAEKPNKFITKDKFNNNILNLNAIVQEFINSNGQLKSGEDAEYKFLKAIGFKYDDLGKIKQNLRDPKNRKDYSIDYLFKAVKELRDAQASGNATEEGWKIINAFKSNPVETLSKGFPAGVVGLPNSAIYVAGLKQTTAVNRLIELQNRYGATSSNFSVLNAAKKRVNEHTTDNTLTVIADALNTAENKTDLFKQGSITSYLDPRRNPWTNNLQTFNTLFDASNKKREGRSIAIEMASGTQIAGKDGTTTTDLDPRSKFIQEFHTMLKSGIQEILRPGSKSSSFGWRLDGGIEWPGIGTKEDKHLYVDFDTFLNLNDELDAIEKIILPYVSSEVARINIFKTNPEAKNYIGYNKSGRDGKPSGEQFNYFDAILTDTTKKEILSKVNTTEIDLLNHLTTDPTLKEKILKETQNYFEAKSKELYNYLQEAKYVDPKLMDRFNLPQFTGAQKEQLLMKTYMYNSWIHNVETSVIFYGDIAQYDHTKQDFHKRTSGLISNGRRFRTDVAAIRYINEQFNLGKTYASTLGAKYDKFVYNGSLNTAVIQEIKRDSVYIDDIKAGLEKFYKENTKMSAEKIKETVDREVEKYTKKEIKEGDGQGYITFDAYRTLKKLQNKWSDKQEEVYQKIVKGEPITGPLDEFFPVYKLQNFAYLEDTVLPVTAFHKFALFPLIPSVIKQGSDLDKMHKSMLEQNIQYLTFDSGSKVGTLTSDGEPDKAIDNNGRFNDSVVFTKNTFNAGFLKEVTNVPNKYKGKTIFSTQLRKLILDGLYEQGDMTMPQYSGLVKAYEDSVAFNTELLKAELMEEIGYVEGKGLTQPEKFLQVIKENLKRKDYPDHLLRALKTNSDGSLKYDLSYFLDAKTIEDTIMSIVEKKFVRQNVKGEALVQVASSFTNNMWTSPSQTEVKKYIGTNTLPFYHPGKDGKTNAMKVAIAMQGDFFKLLNLNHNDKQPIGTIERLNEMIKNDQWLDTDGNRKAITMTAVRIPVQGLNSMEFMEVYEFLDPAAGSIIIVPTEIVAKSGGDFDVDKLTTFMPNIGGDGKAITSNMTKEQFFEAYAKTSDKEKKEMMKRQKMAVENSFIENIKGLLELPENFASLVRPNDTALLQELSKQLEDKVSDFDKYEKVNGESTNVSGKGKKMISPTTVLEQRYNVAKHGHNIIGKAVLGIAASENAMNPVFNQAGVTLPEKYKMSEYDPNLGKYVEFGDPVYDMRLFLPHNKNKKTGRISLSNIYDVGGVDKIADVVSQGMNGWVDVEKDEWVFYIQGNYELAPTMLYLLRAGVPREYAVKFVSSPFIREYAEELRKISGPFAKSMGIAAKEKPFERYEATTRVIARHMQDYFNASTSMLQANDEITVYVKQKVKGAWIDVPTQMTYGELRTNLNNSTYNLNSISAVDIDISGKTRTLYLKPTATNAGYYTATSKANEKYEQGYPIEVMDELIEAYSKGQELTPNQNIAAMGMLLHFNEIQKQIQGIGLMKRRSKPDTTLFRNIQEIILRDLDIESLDTNSKVDKASKDKIFNESITSSLGDKRIIVDVVSQMLSLRNGNATNKFIEEALANSTYKGLIGKKFGFTNDGMVNFVDTFKNNISNFILQNYLSNFMDAKGNIVKVPQEFKEMPVKLSKNLSTDIEIKDGVVYVNSQNLREDFSNKSYLDTAVGPRSYAQRPGLEPFKIEQDPFPSEEAYIKYSIFRAYLQNKGYTGTELNKIALLDAFNYNALMRNNDYSYTNEVLDLIQKYPKLTIDYPILEQISILSTSASTDFNILTLTDRDAIDGMTKDTYANNIRSLANPRIQKVADPEENLRISRLFYMLPLVAVYQHGVGSTLYGFDQVLPQDMIQSAMQNASNLFKLNYWDSKTLSHVFDFTVSTEQKQFKNFVLTEDEFNKEAPLRALEAEEDPFEAIDNEPIFVQPTQPIEVPQTTQAPIKAKTTDQYRYFGSMYTIKLQDGIGVDVEGYKGKADAKAKLLNAYNENPNVDPQNGREFRETPTQLDVQSQNSADTFVFADGIAISVPFQLNTEQQAALYKLENFYNNPAAYDNEITLSGYAGTGKTTILGIFDKYLKEKSYVKPIYTSPTHRANAVTKMKNPKAKVKTLHSLFGLNPMLNLEGDQLDVRDVKTESFKKPELNRRDVIIVDESSMVTNELYDLIQQFKKDLDLRVIFAGDKGQLGPVQDDTKLESKVFDDPKNQAQLTKVERTGDNPILLNSTRAREGQDFTYVTEEINGNGVEFLDTPDRLNQVMGQNLKEMQESGNMLYFRILSSLNKDVAKINLQARDIMFGEEAKKTPYIKGDILMGYDNIGDDLINSGDYVVEDLSELTDITVKVPVADLSSGYLQFGKPKEVSLKGYNVTVKDILNPDKSFTMTLPAEGNDDALAEIAKGLLELKGYYPRVQGRDRGALFSEISGVSKQIVFNKDIKENGRFLAKKGIDYGYAHTIHKSQGGTYNKVLIFDDSISSLAAALADKRKLGMNGQQSIKDQLKYVAISRASEYAYVYNSKDTAVGGFDFRGEEPATFTEADMDTAAVASFSFATEQTPTPQVQTKGDIEMRSDNVTKIFSGNKTVTNRTSLINDGKYTIKNSADVVELKYIGKSTINGNQVTIVNEKTNVVSTRTLDQLAKAEGFKDAADFRANNKFSTNYLNGTQSRFLYQVSPVTAVSADAEAGLGKIPETNTDLQDFKDAVAKNNNIFPNKVTTSAGRLYVLNSDGLYNLVDSLSGTVLMKNIDLTTGEVGLPSNVNVPATNAYKTELLNQIQVLKQQYQLEELLGQYGYDIKDLIDTIQNATTKDQVDDVASLINEKICK